MDVIEAAHEARAAFVGGSVVTVLGLVENGHPLLGGGPTPALWISPPIRHLGPPTESIYLRF
nr:hypothetical protein [Streptomyces sp. S10(2018)]